jgi:hypothetical protein
MYCSDKQMCIVSALIEMPLGAVTFIKVDLRHAAEDSASHIPPLSNARLANNESTQSMHA